MYLFNNQIFKVGDAELAHNHLILGIDMEQIRMVLFSLKKEGNMFPILNWTFSLIRIVEDVMQDIPNILISSHALWQNSFQVFSSIKSIWFWYTRLINWLPYLNRFFWKSVKKSPLLWPSTTHQNPSSSLDTCFKRLTISSRTSSLFLS